MYHIIDIICSDRQGDIVRFGLAGQYFDPGLREHAFAFAHVLNSITVE